MILDRVHQARVVNALEPEWEARFEPKSYGFRPAAVARTRGHLRGRQGQEPEAAVGGGRRSGRGGRPDRPRPQAPGSLEPDAGKLARPVLRGAERSNALGLPARLAPTAGPRRGGLSERPGIRAERDSVLGNAERCAGGEVGLGHEVGVLTCARSLMLVLLK